MLLVFCSLSWTPNVPVSQTEFLFFSALAIGERFCQHLHIAFRNIIITFAYISKNGFRKFTPKATSGPIRQQSFVVSAYMLHTNFHFNAQKLFIFYSLIFLRDKTQLAMNNEHYFLILQALQKQACLNQISDSNSVTYKILIKCYDDGEDIWQFVHESGPVCMRLRI